MNIWENKKKYYQEKFKKYGASPKALGWWNEDSINIRYENLLKDIRIEGKSILDIGCGFGDIIPHLEKKAGNFEFLGVDMTFEFIEEAKKRYSKYEFKAVNYFKKPLKQKFDIIVTSGTLNSNLPKGKQVEYRKQAIKEMWEQTNEVLAFNMAGSHPKPKNSSKSKIYYADSLEILEFCLKLSSKIIFRQDYLPKDFSILLFI